MSAFTWRVQIYPVESGGGSRCGIELHSRDARYENRRTTLDQKTRRLATPVFDTESMTRRYVRDDSAIEQQGSAGESTQMFSAQDLDQQQLGTFISGVDLLTYGAITLLAVSLCHLLLGP